MSNIEDFKVGVYFRVIDVILLLKDNPRVVIKAKKSPDTEKVIYDSFDTPSNTVGLLEEATSHVTSIEIDDNALVLWVN